MKGEKVIEMMMKTHLNQTEMTAFSGMVSAEARQLFILEHVSACEACKEFMNELKDFFGSPLGEFVKKGYQSAGPKTLLWISFISVMASELKRQVGLRSAVDCRTPEEKQRDRDGKDYQTLGFCEVEYCNKTRMRLGIQSRDYSDVGLKIRILTDGGETISFELQDWKTYAARFIIVPDTALDDLVAMRYKIEIYKTL